ncbi:MAG: hypothetical protein U9N43_09175 [Euryarchaeota archaeon]|nr:hypothetical protein [Euryarchaeota archaeon]
MAVLSEGHALAKEIMNGAVLLSGLCYCCSCASDTRGAAELCGCEGWVCERGVCFGLAGFGYVFMTMFRIDHVWTGLGVGVAVVGVIEFGLKRRLIWGAKT